jgi:glycine/D-amino acid oxidase-like deaminating enzyme
MENEVDPVVVGGGAMGLATASCAASAGASVVVLKRSGPRHHRGRHTTASGPFRHAHEDPAYVRTALAAEQARTRLEHNTGQTPTGIRLADRPRWRHEADDGRAAQCPLAPPHTLSRTRHRPS